MDRIRRGSLNCDAATQGATQRELALRTHMELGKTKLAGEAGAYTFAKRLIGGGYGTAQGLVLPELDIEDLEDAGMQKGEAKLLTGRVSQNRTPSGGEFRRFFEKCECSGGGLASIYIYA